VEINMSRILKLTAVMSVPFTSPALADDLIGVGGTAIYPSFPNGRPNMTQITE
jgi:hypothetical protein